MTSPRAGSPTAARCARSRPRALPPSSDLSSPFFPRGVSLPAVLIVRQHRRGSALGRSSGDQLQDTPQTRVLSEGELRVNAQRLFAKFGIAHCIEDSETP